MYWRTVTAAIMITVLLVGFMPASAMATSCMPGTVFQLTARAALVITARVAAVDTTPGRQVWLPSGSGISAAPEAGTPYTLAVERVFKGRTAPTITVYGRSILGSPHPALGERWLLTLHQGPDQRLQLGACVPNRKLGDGEPLPENLAWARVPRRTRRLRRWG